MSLVFGPLHLPCGLSVTVSHVSAPERADAPYLFQVEGDGVVRADGYTTSPRAALVSVRWAVTSVLERSNQTASKALEKAIEDAAH